MRDPGEDIIGEFDPNTNTVNILGKAKHLFGDFSLGQAIDHASFSGQNYIEMFFAVEEHDTRAHIVKELFFLDYVFQCFDNELSFECFEECLDDERCRDYLDAVYTAFSIGFDKVKEEFFNANKQEQ